MKKTIEEVKKLNTKRLLRFYRAERNRMYNKGYRYIYIDEDENGNKIMIWDNNLKFESSETFNDDIDFLDLIKKELNTREHVT